MEADVDLAKIAQTTVGFTGADLENLLNEAALLAAKSWLSICILLTISVIIIISHL